MFKSYNEAVEWITGLTAFGIRPGLDRITAMMDYVGNPQRRLKFVHVAGTNGKGSTCAMISECLMASGYDVGTFTSPYMEKYTNRIQFNGEDIPEETVLELTNIFLPIVRQLAESELGSPTMFEVTTAIALFYFSKKAIPDYVIWETGLGGRQDVTNIVYPVASVITNIGYDHMEILGDTIEEIALEKAGIIKAGMPVITACAQPEAVQVLEKVAAEKNSTLYLLNRDFSYEITEMKEGETTFLFRGPYCEYGPLKLSLAGEHQVQNAAVALMTLEVLRQFNAAIVEEEDLLAGMKRLKWPGRLEQISDQPVMLLDGAHNPEGAKALADTLTRIYPSQKKHFVIGMLRSKKHQSYLEHIMSIADTIIFTDPDFRGYLTGAELMELANSISNRPPSGIKMVYEPNWQKAVKQLREVTGEDDIGIVTGSLYLVADARSWCLNQTLSDKGW